MENLKVKMEEQLREIDRLIMKSNKTLERLKDTPNKKIMASKSNGSTQYYWVDWKTKERKYVSVSEKRLLRNVAQRDYEKVVNRKLCSLKSTLEKFINKYDIDEIYAVYNKMSEGKKALVTPIEEVDEVYIKNWLNDTYDPMGFMDNTEFYSSNGVRVRSKSELIIANLLEQYEIPYKYERPIQLRGLGSVRPDFICLNKRKRSEFVWEHFGMMDNGEYANKNISKLNMYQQNGYYLGENMIASFETSQQPISSKNIKNLIEQHLQ